LIILYYKKIELYIYYNSHYIKLYQQAQLLFTYMLAELITTDADNCDSIDDPVCIITEIIGCYTIGVILIKTNLYYAYIDVSLYIAYIVMRIMYWQDNLDWTRDTINHEYISDLDFDMAMLIFRNGYNTREAIRHGLIDDI